MRVPRAPGQSLLSRGCAALVLQTAVGGSRRDVAEGVFGAPAGDGEEGHG